MSTDPEPPIDSRLRPPLEGYGTVRTKVEEFPEIRGYEDRVTKLKSHFYKAERRSFVLLGKSGAGKTAVLHSLFRELVQDGWRILETSSSEMTRGAVYVGEWETRLINLMEVGAASKRVILYVTDLHNLKGTGTSRKSDANMADAITRFLERGDVVVIGECTPDAYRRGVDPHPGLKRTLTPFQLEPAKPEDVRKLIHHAFEAMQTRTMEEMGCHLELSATTVSSLEQLGGIYFSGTVQPGASIDLLRNVVELRLEALKKTDSRGTTVPLEQADIVAALHRISGLPLYLLDDNIPLDLKETRKFFESRVVGQDEALTTLIDLITLIKAGLSDPGKPSGILLFAGPTGVGKTEVAKALAEFLFGSADRMIRCDMSEYKDYHSYEKFIGRSEKENDTGSLVSQVRRQPFSIILLDEVEKANPNIFDILLQALDDGRLTDPNGNTTDLTQTIIIMTSNLGSDLSRPMPVGFDREAPDSGELVEAALRQYFRPEFLNRIDHIIRFRPLQRAHIRTLAKRELGKALLRNGLMRRELRVSVEPAVHDLLALKGYDEKYGARPLRRQVEKLAVLPVAREIIGLSGKNRGSLIQLDVVDDTIKVTLLEDRQTRTAQKMINGISVVDPVDGSKSRVAVSQIAEDLAAFAATIASLRSQYEEEELDVRKTRLVEESSRADFWDDQDSARQTLGEIYRRERLSGAIREAERSHETLAGIGEHLSRQPEEGRLRKLALDLAAARNHANLVVYALKCREAEDRRDAFIAIRLVDESSTLDPVFQLAESYRQWAERKDYSFRIVHEEEVSPNCLKEVVIELGGPAAFGIFKFEEGEHEFVEDRKDRTPGKNCFVSVRVLGITPAKEKFEPETKVSALNRPSRFGGKIRSSLASTDPESGRSIVIESTLKGEELIESGAGLLKAEIDSSKAAPDRESEGIIRRYVMSPVAEIKDRRVPSVSIQPRDFWRGELDELLQAGVMIED